MRNLLLLACLLPILNVLIPFLFQRTFPEHNNGIVFITGASTGFFKNARRIYLPIFITVFSNNQIYIYTIEGIGRHASEYLANTTKYLVFAGVRKEADAESIRAANIPNLLPLIVDVTSTESCSQAFEKLRIEMELRKLPLIALVNNAGIARNG